MEWKHALPGQKGAFVLGSGSYAMGVLKGKARVARAYAIVLVPLELDI